jgi:hypothetical protein
LEGSTASGRRGGGVSRAAYFRRLRTAVERLAEHIAAVGAPADVA